MSIFISLFLLGTVSIFSGIAFNKKTEEIFFTLTLSTVLILFLFYCADLLFIGRVTTYVLLAILLSVSIFLIINTPGIKAHVETHSVENFKTLRVIWKF